MTTTPKLSRKERDAEWIRWRRVYCWPKIQVNPHGSWDDTNLKRHHWIPLEDREEYKRAEVQCANCLSRKKFRPMYIDEI